MERTTERNGGRVRTHVCDLCGVAVLGAIALKRHWEIEHFELYDPSRPPRGSQSILLDWYSPSEELYSRRPVAELHLEEHPRTDRFRPPEPPLLD
jgi:hypothetical protein